jgi:uncharacterized glyoxalase superfamily protein PhnB
MTLETTSTPSTLSTRKITPNLVVSNVERSLTFYEQVLGFSRGMTVPGQPPFAFASVTCGPVEIFFNDRSALAKDAPQLGDRSPGGGNSMFIEVDGVDALHDRIASRVRIVMALVTQWYGMREFACEDPDGYLIIFAERAQE